jgi:phosphoribosylamine--glycine ligase
VRVLVVGSGGREHALAWKLAQGAAAAEVHAAPGNPGIAALGACHPIRADDVEGLVALCTALQVDLVVVGPEAPLVAGVGDALRHGGLAVFGPGAAAARIEGSKSFAREVMTAAGVPTARAFREARAPCVLKADGLAAGKGVFVCHTQRQVEQALAALAGLGQPFAAEELLEGEEVSLFALCDGETALALAPARDFKRALDGDEGPNTGGMGAYSPVPALGPERVEELLDLVHRPVLAELSRRGMPFVGNLFAGLMLTPDGVRVLEFNARFGDPETQALLPRLDGDLGELLSAATHGELAGVRPASARGASVAVVVAAADYPARGDEGSPIRGVQEAEAAGALVFHAGTALREGELVTNGGRILTLVGAGADLAEARSVAYAGAGRISFAGARYRGDIAAAAAETA